MLPCFECESCREEQYARCSNYNYFGSRCDGGLSECIAVPEWNIVTFSDQLDYKTAALCEPAAVALHSVEKGEVSENDSTVIIGSGTIAILTAFWCRQKGADAVVVCRNERKSSFIESLGLKAILEKNAENLHANKVFECVGTPEAINMAVNSAQPGGSIVLVGNPSGDIAFSKQVYWKILRRELNVKGTWNSEYSNVRNNWKDVIQTMETHQIPFEKLITDIYDMKNIHTALDNMRSTDTFSIKTMIDI